MKNRRMEERKTEKGRKEEIKGSRNEEKRE